MTVLRGQRNPIGWLWGRIPLGFRRLLLNLLVIAGLVDLIRRGYILFITHNVHPVWGTIIFLIELGIWIWIITVLRKRHYGHKQPKFKLVFFVVLVIVLVCAFAGIQPLASYKDSAITAVGGWFSNLEVRTSEGPADVRATAYIVEGIRLEESGEKSYFKLSSDNNVSWIIDLQVENIEYEKPISSGWKLAAGEDVYNPESFIRYSPPQLNVYPHETGNTILRFYVPRELKIDETELVYEGEEPHTHAKINGSDRTIEFFDINTKSEVIIISYVKVADIWGIDFGLLGLVIFVQLETTEQTEPGNYKITLLAGKEDFGSKKVYLSKEKQLETIEWDSIGADTRAWAEIGRGKTAREVFQVKIEFNPY